MNKQEVDEKFYDYEGPVKWVMIKGKWHRATHIRMNGEWYRIRYNDENNVKNILRGK